jgi:hypothetical protein
MNKNKKVGCKLLQEKNLNDFYFFPDLHGFYDLVSV